ncbi:MAG: hypothetical protein M4579_002161 [Chaenotheca gracillima]|nr:MAG: hypothetical protein M4579_002161 [Chaenotheca gracillima]
MPPAKRRKVAPAGGTSGISSSFPPAHKSIQAWSKISKPQVLRDRLVEKKKAITKETVVITQYSLPEGELRGEGKWKRLTKEPVEASEDSGAVSILGKKDGDADEIHSIPVQDTPTKGARRFLDCLALNDLGPSTVDKPHNKDHVLGAGILSPAEREAGILTTALQHIINLHSSFLTALSLHHAHNGVLAPADLRELIPNIERVWKRRAVTLEDVRRILGVLDFVGDDGSILEKKKLQLSDYGGGKICVEILVDSDQDIGIGTLVREDAFNSRFIQNLKQLRKDWAENRGTSKHVQSDDEEVDSFISHLPMAQIRPCTSVKKASAFLANGQKRLQAFRAEGVAMKKENIAPAKAAGTGTGQKFAEKRGNSLLERIRAKQLHQSTLGPALSPAQLAHQAALDRLEEIVPLLHHLSTSSRARTNNLNLDGNAESAPSLHGTVPSLESAQDSRSVVSITLPTFVQHLQNSLRNPISPEEGERAVRTLAEDVAPGWVSVVSVGKVVAIVVRGSKPSTEELRKQVALCRERLKGAERLRVK